MDRLNKGSNNVKATIARVLGSLLSGLTVFLVASVGLQEAEAAAVTAGVIGTLTTLSYGLGHKLLRRFGLDD